jgi:tripartite-type tricarboxylate transporter receptor subunit TctC
VKKLNEATVQAMETPVVRERLQSLGANLVAPDRRSPEYLAQFVRSEVAKWADPIRASGASMD